MSHGGISMSIALDPIRGAVDDAISRINTALWPVTGECIFKCAPDHRDHLVANIEVVRKASCLPHRRAARQASLEQLKARLKRLDATTATLATPAKAEAIAVRLEDIAASDAPRSTQAAAMVATLEGRRSLGRTESLCESLLQELSDLPEFLRELAESGWYLSDRLHYKMPCDFPDVVKNEDREKIDRIIIEHLQEQIDGIKYEIIDNYPKRSDALSQAFHAHKQGMYYCSIPVFYSQADGIFKDKFGGGIFMYHKRREVAKNEIELFNKSISYVKSLSSNESDLLPESSQSKNLYGHNYCIRRGFLLSNNFHGLRRNPIMHGDSVDYGNELNSLKSISFLDWIHCLKRERGSR